MHKTMYRHFTAEWSFPVGSRVSQILFHFCDNETRHRYKHLTYTVTVAASKTEEKLACFGLIILKIPQMAEGRSGSQAPSHPC